LWPSPALILKKISNLIWTSPAPAAVTAFYVPISENTLYNYTQEIAIEPKLKNARKKIIEERRFWKQQNTAGDISPKTFFSR